VPSESTDFYEDIIVPSGTDLFWAYSVEPLDLTGCTGSFIASFGTFATIIVAAQDGDDVASTWTLDIPAASMPAAGVYTFAHLMTFTTGSILPYGHGSIVVGSV